MAKPPGSIYPGGFDLKERGKEYWSVDLKSAACRNCRSLLGEIEAEHAVGIAGAYLVGIDAAEIEAAAIGAVEALTAEIIGFILAVVLLTLDADGHTLILNVDIDIILAETGQLCIKSVGITQIAHVSTEEGRSTVGEKAALHFLHLAEGIEGVEISHGTLKRNKFKHYIYLHKLLTHYILFSIAQLLFVVVYKIQYIYE